MLISRSLCRKQWREQPNTIYLGSIVVCHHQAALIARGRYCSEWPAVAL